MSLRLFCNLVLPSNRATVLQSMKCNLNITKRSLNGTVLKKNVQVCAVPNVNSYILRSYAKGKDKGKGNKNKNAKVEINTAQLSSVIDLAELKTNYQACVDKLKEDFVKNVSLRSSVGSIETLKINLEGKDYELQEIAQIIRKNPKIVILNVSSFPQAIPNILKEIEGSGLNLNPQQDGTSLFIPVPKVTKEHREGLAKNAKILYVKCRDHISHVQLDYVKQAKNFPNISEDLCRSVQKQINSIGEEYKTIARNIHDIKNKELVG